MPSGVATSVPTQDHRPEPSFGKVNCFKNCSAGASLAAEGDPRLLRFVPIAIEECLRLKRQFLAKRLPEFKDAKVASRLESKR